MADTNDLDPKPKLDLHCPSHRTTSRAEKRLPLGDLPETLRATLTVTVVELSLIDREMYLKIGRPQNVCVSCGAEIAVAGKHPSALLPGEAEPDDNADAPVRRDYCAHCWEKAREVEYFSFWLARREKPKPKKIRNRRERNNTLLSYFDFLREKDDPEYTEHLFFIAHLLMKFSVFRWVRNDPPKEEGAPEMIVFKNTVTDDLVSIASVQLHEDRLVVIKREVDEFLTRVSEESGQQA